MRLKFLISWELRNLVRFPILELFIAIAVYMTMLSRQQGSMPGLSGNSPWSTYPKAITNGIMFFFLSDAQYLYVPIILAATIFASIGIAREIEAGFIKVSLSHPVRRRDLFLVKFGSCFLTSLAIFAIALFSAMFLKHWTAIPYILSFPSTILTVLEALVYEIFYATSIATALAVFSRSTATSFIGSISILYLPVYMAQTTGLNIPFVPPGSTQLFVHFLITGTRFWEYDFLTLIGATVVPISIALALLIISFIYFTKRYDLS